MSLSKFQIATFSFGCFSIGAGCGYIYHKSCFNFFTRTQLLWPFIFNCIGITFVDTHKKLIKVIENDEQFSIVIARFKKDLDKVSLFSSIATLLYDNLFCVLLKRKVIIFSIVYYQYDLNFETNCFI